MLPLFIFSKLWLFLLLAFMFMKFSCMGGRRKCAHSKYRAHRATGPEEKNTNQPPFKEDEIVPDGQSGF